MNAKDDYETFELNIKLRRFDNVFFNGITMEFLKRIFVRLQSVGRLRLDGTPCYRTSLSLGGQLDLKL